MLLFTEYNFLHDIGMTVWRVMGGFILASIVAVGMLCYGAAMPLAGWLVARRGTRYVLLCGTAMLVLATLWAVNTRTPLGLMLSFGVLIVGLALTGLHPRTALTGAWTAIANIGPVWGPEISANGSIHEFPTSAKWLMILGMYIGRLELLSVFVLLLPRFWRS